MEEMPKPQVILPPSVPKIPVIVFSLVLLFMALLSLSYFNLLPFKFPSGLLKPAAKKLIPSTLKCPLGGAYCQQGLPVILGQTKTTPFVGLGYVNLASGSAILSMIEGKYDSSKPGTKNDPDATVLTVTNEKLRLKVTYEFLPLGYISSGKEGKNVKQGELLGWASGKILSKNVYSQPFNLVVSVQDLNTGNFTSLSPLSFKPKNP